MDRIMGIITLKAPVYRQVAEDAGATTNAAIITVVAALVAGFFGGLVSFDTATNTSSVNVMSGVILAIISVVLGLIGWFVAGWVLAFVAKMFGGKTDTQEMLRVTGYVNIFSLVGVLSVLPLITPALGCVTGLVGLLAAILRLIGYVIGVREAAEFSTTNAIITAIVAAIVNFLIVAVVGGTLFGIIAVAMGATGAAR
ncbi:MAG: YIP1 family protein [Chloroflexi bacterium]|nr:YIP1 family protein [Chloroflexota bacterium]